MYASADDVVSVDNVVCVITVLNVRCSIYERCKKKTAGANNAVSFVR